jgi:hypothetical protein
MEVAETVVKPPRAVVNPPYLTNLKKADGSEEILPWWAINVEV